MLKEEGYKVDTFTDSQEALKHFAQSDPLPLQINPFLDIRMPNPNGIQLYYRLKAINPNVRIIFVTALDVIKDELALLPGFSPDYDLIKKPLERENYINRIKTALS